MAREEWGAGIKLINEKLLYSIWVRRGSLQATSLTPSVYNLKATSDHNLLKVKEINEDRKKFRGPSKKIGGMKSIN